MDNSLCIQVTVAFAVAEATFEFEHKDLHRFSILHNHNIFLVNFYYLLSRKGCKTLDFVLDGKKMHVNTHGHVASIIDFTLSRINTSIA